MEESEPVARVNQFDKLTAGVHSRHAGGGAAVAPAVALSSLTSGQKLL